MGYGDTAVALVEPDEEATINVDDITNNGARVFVQRTLHPGVYVKLPMGME